jgi:hypothetical protein
MPILRQQLVDDLSKLRPVGVSFLLVFLALGSVLLLHPRFLDQHHVQLGLLFGVLLGPVLGALTGRWKNVNETAVCKDIAELYLEGKMKRYSLLFSVNGGAFAIVQLSAERKLPGELSIFALSVGLIVFTVLMISDVWLWGADMREKHSLRLFRPVGQIILLMIGALLVAGWALIGAL